MCRVLAYIGPETPLENLLLKPENSLVNQTLDPERHPELQLAGWGFGAWGEHLLKPEKPLLYHRPTAAFYDDNVEGIIPSLQGSTMLAHVRAAAYNADVVLADENCHPYWFVGTPWIIAQRTVTCRTGSCCRRELLQHCKDTYLKQMRGNTDTEFLYVLLLSLLESDSNDDVQRGFEEMLRLVVQAMKDLDLVELAKLKTALVSPDRIIGVNFGSGYQGETDPAGDWRELRESGPGTDDFALSMLLEPMYLETGCHSVMSTSFEFEICGVEEATSAIFASEALTDDADEWSTLEFGEIVFLEKLDALLRLRPLDRGHDARHRRPPGRAGEAEPARRVHRHERPQVRTSPATGDRGDRHDRRRAVPLPPVVAGRPAGAHAAQHDTGDGVDDGAPGRRRREAARDRGEQCAQRRTTTGHQPQRERRCRHLPAVGGVLDRDRLDDVLVEGVGRRDEVAHPLRRRQEHPVAGGVLDHHVGEGTPGRVVPAADDDAYAAGAAHAGDAAAEAFADAGPGHGATSPSGSRPSAARPVATPARSSSERFWLSLALASTEETRSSTPTMGRRFLST